MPRRWNPRHFLPLGLNELKWVYDTGISGNWVSFKCHKLRMGLSGTVIGIK